MRRTLDDIRRDGMDALRERLGRAGMIRFLQQFENGSGDYATQRRKWVNRSTLSGLKRQASARRRGKSGGRAA